ncbi:50S ribosomal protein L1 [Candidatus Woesearchaeota archaeon]|nr:50S ribosomal protein L1 [Candidatus Woesearchaeota archaeon]
MEKAELQKALKELKEKTPKRKFSQSIELIFNIKGIDLKKTENQQEFFTILPFGRGRKVTVCALIGPELKDDAGKACDKVIIVDDFQRYAENKKEAKKLAKEYDFFIAQGEIMAKVAGAFGKALGPRGKMPNPKAECVVTAKTALKPLYEKLQRTVKVSLKKAPIIQAMIGTEETPEEQVIENIQSLYKQVIHALPQEKNNIRSVLLKMTMGPVVKIG